MRKKIIFLLFAFLAISWQGNAQLLSEDFEGGTSLPSGWTNNDLAGNGEVWEFDNPGNRTINAPVSGNFAIFDSDHYGNNGTAEDAALESPAFDASAATNVILEFDHYFKEGYGGAYEVEVFNGTDWVSVLSGTSSTQNAQHEYIDVSQELAGVSNAQVRFHWTGNWSWYWAVDNISVTAPTCLAPESLSVSGITISTADVSWTDNNNGSSTFTVQWRETGAASWNSYTTAAGVTSYQITGLSSHTTYEWQVTADCGNNGTSNPAVGPNFTTACNTVSSFPYEYGFEDVASNAGGDWSASCWSANPENTGAGPYDAPFRWTVDDGETPSGNTGPAGANSGTQYAYTEASGSNNGDVAELISPVFDMTSLTEVEISFFYHMYGADMGSLHLDTYDGNTWTNDVWTISGQQQADKTDPWIKASVIVANNVTQFRFRAIRGDGYYGDMAIDDIKVQEAPDCLDPSDLSVSNITETTADLSWTDNNNGNASYTIEWREAGAGTWTNSASTATGDTSYTITGLNGKTEYEWQITADCGANGTSSSVAGANFITPGSCGFYKISLLDSYGDGWNGGTLDVYINGTLVLDDLTLSNGAGPEDTLIPVDINDILSFDYTEGNWGTENQYIVYDEAGNELANEGDGGAVPGDIGDPGIPNGLQSCPTCPSATDLAVNNITDDAADLTWTDNTSGSASYNINWREIGTSTWNSVSTAAGATSYSLTGLNDQTEYEWQLTTDCGNGDVSQTLTGPNFTTLASCLEPTNLAVSNITTTTADVSWTDNNSGNSTYLVEWREPGATNWDSATTAAGDTSYQITGLSVHTTYEWQVTADCGADGTSNAVSGTNFTTACNAVTSFPYEYGFEDVASNTGGDWSASCWSANPENTGAGEYDPPFRWTVTNDDTPSGNTGPNAANSGTQYAYTEASGSSDGDIAELISPDFDMTSLTNVEISFYYHMYGADMGSLHLDTYDGNTWTDDVWSISGQQQTAETDPWIKVSVIVANNVTKFRFRGIRGPDYKSDMAVDDIKVQEAPTCLEPTDLAVNNITETTADLSWTDTNNGNASYTVQWREAGSTTWNSATTGTGDTSYTITGLNGKTEYEWQITADCGANGTSSSVAGDNFITPGSCGFYKVSLIDSYGDGWNGGTLDVYINGSLAIDDLTLSGGAGPVDTLIPVDINDILSFDYTEGSWGSENQYIVYDESGNELANEGDGGAVPGDIGDPSIPNGLQSCPTCPSATDLAVNNITDDAADLTWTDNTSGSASYNINWREVGTSTWNAASTSAGATSYTLTGLDDETEYEWQLTTDCGNGDVSQTLTGPNFTTLPSCVPPSDLAVAANTDTTADLTWTDNNNGSSTYILEWRETGTTTWNSVTTAVGATSYQLTGLTEKTHYEWQLTADCGVDDGTSATVTGPEIYTWYCESVPASLDGDGITQVVLGSETYAIPAVTYEDLSDQAVASLALNDTAPLFITFETGYTYDTNVWIDFNDDFVFDDNELVYQGESTADNPTTLDASFFLDPGLSPGNHYMRIGTADTGQATPDPCYNGSWGVTLDFLVNITCSTIDVFPYEYGFENMSPSFVSDWSASCWSSTPANAGTGEYSGPYRWVTTENATSSPNTGPSAAHSGSMYAFTEASGYLHQGDITELYSPDFDMSGLNNPMLAFYYHMYGNQMGSLHLDTYDGQTWTNDVWSISGQQQTSSSDDWELVEITIPNNVVKFRFRGVRGNGTRSDMAVDDIKVSEACFTPESLNVVGVLDDSAVVSWEDNSNSSASYMIEWREVGTSLWNQDYTTAGATSYTITNLSTNTEYEWRMNASCGNYSSEVLIGENFTTLCDRIASFPYNYGFEDMTDSYVSDWSATCWNVNPENAGTGEYSGPFRWLPNENETSSPNTGPAAAHTGNIFAYTEASGYLHAGDVTELYSPQFDMANLGAPQISFYYHMYGNQMGSLHLDTFDGTTWTNDVWSISGQQQTNMNADWILVEVPITSDVVRFRFRGVRGNGTRGDMAIDDIEVADTNVAPVAENPDNNPNVEDSSKPAPQLAEVNLVNLYQNEAFFNLQSMDEHNITGVQVYDLSGRLLLNSNNYNEKLVQVELQNVATGNLLIFVIHFDNGNSLIKKAVKK